MMNKLLTKEPFDTASNADLNIANRLTPTTRFCSRKNQIMWKSGHQNIVLTVIEKCIFFKLFHSFLRLMLFNFVGFMATYAL